MVISDTIVWWRAIVIWQRNKLVLVLGIVLLSTTGGGLFYYGRFETYIKKKVDIAANADSIPTPQHLMYALKTSL